MRCRRQALRGRPRGTLADDRPLALARRRQEAALTLCRGAQCRTSPNATAANSFATARCRKSSPTDAILCGEEFRTAKGRDHVLQARVDLAMIDDHWPSWSWNSSCLRSSSPSRSARQHYWRRPSRDGFIKVRPRYWASRSRTESHLASAPPNPLYATNNESVLDQITLSRIA